jgi:hypothetical protein
VAVVKDHPKAPLVRDKETGLIALMDTGAGAIELAGYFNGGDAHEDYYWRADD